MTQSDIINAFCQVRLWRVRIDHQAREIDRLETLLQRCTPSLDQAPVQGGVTADLADRIDQMAGLRQELMQMMATEAKWSALTRNLLDQLDDPFLAEIMMMRYLDQRTWAQIAQDLHCSERTAYRGHSRAIDTLAEVVIDCQYDLC